MSHVLHVSSLLCGAQFLFLWFTPAFRDTERGARQQRSRSSCSLPLSKSSSLLSPFPQMYPSLRCSSEVSSGDVAAAPSSQRVPPVALLPSDQNCGLAESGGNMTIPTLVRAAPPSSQVTKSFRNGRMFVNHNSPLLAQPRALATASPSPTSFPTAGVLPGSSTRSYIVNRSSRVPPVARAGVRSTATTAGLAEGHLAVEPLQSSALSWSGLGPERRGVHAKTAVPPIDVSRDISRSVSLEIEGVQTGEEVAVNVTSARRRTSSTTSNTNGSFDSVRLQQLRRQLKKVTTQLNSTSDVSRRQKQEDQQRQAAWSLLLDECETRLLHVQSYHASRERLLVQELSRFIKQLLGEVEAQVVKARAVEQAYANDKAKRDAERAALLDELEALKAAAGTQLSSISSIDSLQKEVDRLRDELEVLRRSASDEQRNLERRLTQTQTTLQSTESELSRYCRESDKDRYLVAQCRLFIQQVCQPGFSVVNGPTLEPVEANRPEPTGFVLVPLTVLLYGYALLPEGDRQAMISHYDNQAKSLQ
ncbi:hypothetical protein JKF63_00195 [Porcisia hertigi]|uniref:Uncharacterized protein n=1 Tax=Porcisia hertigi TaxID=2761500 RepID=A0A836I4J8_9TRYP|nr:hypothetical protein JKF63_00195 [Porcisia hertigi]